mmetsp:Transcript_27767/g.65930  ORF Transcript_27767/g.65930 Transcript_27767/m.65930 type:complete len:109 (-) Transcript_27767:946-1272(-)
MSSFDAALRIEAVLCYGLEFVGQAGLFISTLQPGSMPDYILPESGTVCCLQLNIEILEAKHLVFDALNDDPSQSFAKVHSRRPSKSGSSATLKIQRDNGFSLWGVAGQ